MKKQGNSENLVCSVPCCRLCPFSDAFHPLCLALSLKRGWKRENEEHWERSKGICRVSQELKWLVWKVERKEEANCSHCPSSVPSKAGDLQILVWSTYADVVD